MSKSEQSASAKGVTGDDKLLTDIRKGVEQGHRFLNQLRASGQSGNPQTPPSRLISSTYSSPGSILGKEEDAIVLELSTRYLLAGIEGESAAQCKITFGPEQSRRIGDYRVWLPGYKRQHESLDTWGETYELWRNNIEGLDLGLVRDKLERAVREAYTKHLLVDPGAARLVLSLPSIVPHLVLETILSTLFERWQYPTITLLPSPTMTAISAGLRSALVVDIGWEEVVVTSIYEYREVNSHRSTRGMKELTRHFAQSLNLIKEDYSKSDALRFDLDFVETLMYRALLVIDFSNASNHELRKDRTLESIAEEGLPQFSNDSHDIELEWSVSGSTNLPKIPLKLLISAVQTVLLDTSADSYPDDHELALVSIVFKALLTLPPDVRSLCMSRIVFAGAASTMQGLSDTVLNSLSNLISSSGWTSIKGRHLTSIRPGLPENVRGKTHPPDAKYGSPSETGKDYVEERVRKQKTKFSQQSPSAELREVTSLGSWAGASLLTSLKIRGFVEIERERFLSQGLAGANRENETSVIPQPQRMSSFGISKPVKVADRTSWTLAGWG